MFYILNSKFQKKKSAYQKTRGFLSRIRLKLIALTAKKINSFDNTADEFKLDDLVSFDVFDTLVVRYSHQPNRVIDLTCVLWSKYLSEMLNLPISSENIYFIREGVINEICHANKLKGCDFDFNYDSFIEAFCKKLKLANAVKVKLSEIELQNEISQLKVNDHVLGILESLKRRNKKLIAISDMYMTSKMVSEILSSFGLLQFFDEVYTSGEEGKLKSTGGLFRKLAEKYDTSKWSHVGDNPIGDYKRAKEIGIKSYLLYQHNVLRERKLSYYSYPNLVDESFDHIDDVFLKYTVKNLGFSIAAWMESLVHYCEENKIKNIYFLAREGVVLKLFFDLIMSKRDLRNGIVASVIYVSRRSVNCPFFKSYISQTFSNNEDSFIHIVDMGWGGTIQKEIENVIDKPVYGHYFGTDARFNLLGDGFLFDLTYKNIVPLKFCFPAFELIMTPLEIGTCLNYEFDFDKYIPKLSSPVGILDGFNHDKFAQLSLDRFFDIKSRYSLTDKEVLFVSRKLTFNGFLNPDKVFVQYLSSAKFNFGEYENYLVSNVVNNPVLTTKKLMNGGWIQGVFSYSNIGLLNYPLNFLLKNSFIKVFLTEIKKRIG